MVYCLLFITRSTIQRGTQTRTVETSVYISASASCSFWGHELRLKKKKVKLTIARSYFARVRNRRCGITVSLHMAGKERRNNAKEHFMDTEKKDEAVRDRKEHAPLLQRNNSRYSKDRASVKRYSELFYWIMLFKLMECNVITRITLKLHCSFLYGKIEGSKGRRVTLSRLLVHRLSSTKLRVYT